MSRWTAAAPEQVVTCVALGACNAHPLCKTDPVPTTRWRGSVKVRTGGDPIERSAARDPVESIDRLIWCESGADGESPDGRQRAGVGPLVRAGGPSCARTLSCC